MNETQYKKELLTVLSSVAKNRGLLDDFLIDLLTPAEYVEISKRWQIVKRLYKKQSHRQISDDLGVGVATVNRGARELYNAKGGFKKTLRKLGA